MEVPVDKPPNFDKFLIELEDGHLVIREAEVLPGKDRDSTNAADLAVKARGASHHFDSIRPLRWSVDKDFLIVLDTAGVIHAIDMHLIKGVAYRAPIPVFKLTQLENVAALGDTLEARFVTEGDWRTLHAKPRANALYPLGRPADYRWHAGNWVLMNSTPERSEVVVELDRSVMLNQISAHETVLAYWSDLLHPRASSRTRSEVNAEIPVEAALALRRLDRSMIDRLIPNAQAWRQAAATPRDQFRMYGDTLFGVPTPATVARRITPRAMLAIASAVAGGAALAEGMSRFGFDEGFAHAVRIVCDHVWLLVPAVLTDSVYRHTLMKSAFWLGLVAPAIWATAALYGRLTGRQEDPKVTWVRAGMRTFAKINQPFWRPMARLLGQPHIIKALSLGVNPFRQVRPDSRLGRNADLGRATQLGWVNPLVVGAERRERVRNTGRVLKAHEDLAEERVALARWLAVTVVSQESNFDPASLAAEEDAEGKTVRRTNEEQTQRRRELAYQLVRNLTRRDIDPRELNADEFEHEMERARFAAQRLTERDLPDRYWDRARYEWNRLSSGTLRGLYDFARADNEFWATAEPTKAIADRAWGIFVSDYYLGTAFAMTEGPRANMKDPASLVAQEGVFMNTSPGGRYDILDTPRWYSVNHNAKFTRVFMGERMLETDAAYEPRESTQLEPQFQEPPAWEAFVDFAKDFVNPSTGEYGEILLEQLKVAFAMIQTSYLLTTGARVAFAGSSIETSSLSFLYHFIWGHIQVGVVFDVINSTISRMEKRTARNKARTKAATNAIGRGVRLGDATQYRAGVDALLKLYEGREWRFSPELRRQLDDARQTGPDVVQLTQARDLMFAALAEPPLPGKDPQWIKRTLYVVGVGLATYLGLKMSVPTFDPNVDWNYLIGSSAAYASVIYLTVYGATKSWRAHQRHQQTEQDKRDGKCEGLLAPSAYLSPIRDHAS